VRATGRRLRWVVTHLCWNDGEPDARVLQTGFTLLLLGAMVLRLLGGRAVELVSWPVAGIALSIAAALVVIVVPTAGRSATVTRVMAVVNIAVLGMMADGPDLGTASPLAVLPALWLGLDLGLRGAAVAIGATVSFITVPGLVAHGGDALTIERLVVLPVIVGVGAAAITAGVTAARAAQARAEAREVELTAAMAAIERNRRSAHALFEVVDVGLTLLDRNGQPLLINQRLEEFSEIA
jgi:two-component system, OmpR family, phosphate regulon sensor histidine kinase PhoR